MYNDGKGFGTMGYDMFMELVKALWPAAGEDQQEAMQSKPEYRLMQPLRSLWQREQAAASDVCATSGFARSALETRPYDQK